MTRRCGFGEVGTRRCGWVITKDNTETPGSPASAVGRYGPHNTTYEQEYIRKNGKRFRMLDDDGNIYYYGMLYGAKCLGFEPLDNFGAPNAGCTTIQYLEEGVWETL